MKSYIHGTGRTEENQLIEFTCPPDLRDEVLEFLKSKIGEISIPTSHRYTTRRGVYHSYSRFSITQHKYAGGGPNDDGAWMYMEALEITNPPEGCAPIVINYRNSNQKNFFSEWESLGLAISAFEKILGCNEVSKRFPEMEGFKRIVKCGLLQPWFNAIGDEELIGDYAFPEHMQDDPVYRFGQKFVCYVAGAPFIKTCMGTRFVTGKDKYEQYRRAPESDYFRIVTFDDGWMWNERMSPDKRPLPLDEEQIWITEAMEKFRNFLAGNIKEFEINFLDGQKFISRLGVDKTKAYSLAGDYFLKATFEGVNEPKKGWVNGFKPTEEFPSIIKFVENEASKVDKKVASVEIIDVNYLIGGKKWSGVFHKHI